MNLISKATLSLIAVLTAAGTVAAFKPTLTFQVGDAGAGMEQVETRDRLEERVAANALPPSLPAAAPGGVLAVNAYRNVRVLGHVSAGEFTRLMTAMTLWVSPNQGCAYCHAPQRDAGGNIVKNEEGYPIADINNMHSDELYTKVVARRMLQMTMRINADWKPHVQQTGVTCYTCHHGNPVPLNLWFDQEASPNDDGQVGYRGSQHAPSPIAGQSSLPNGSLRPFLGGGNENVRVISTEALDSQNRASIKETEWTYGFMMHMSKSLGVNCTYCHNTRSMGAWSSSPAPRTSAWYGIRMARELNREYLEPLHPLFPPERLGPTGDVPKVNCATCHAGAFKPLLGASMLKDYPILAEAKPQPPKESAPPVNSAFVGGFGGASSGAGLGGREAGAGGSVQFEPPGEVEPPKPLPSVLPSASTPAFREAVPPSTPR